MGKKFEAYQSASIQNLCLSRYGPNVGRKEIHLRNEIPSGMKCFPGNVHVPCHLPPHDGPREQR